MQPLAVATQYGTSEYIGSRWIIVIFIMDCHVQHFHSMAALNSNFSKSWGVIAILFVTGLAHAWQCLLSLQLRGKIGSARTLQSLILCLYNPPSLDLRDQFSWCILLLLSRDRAKQPRPPSTTTTTTSSHPDNHHLLSLLRSLYVSIFILTFRTASSLNNYPTISPLLTST
jgi:hypothetical protein